MKDAFPTLSDSALFIAADNARPGELKTALQAEIDRRHQRARAEYARMMASLNMIQLDGGTWVSQSLAESVAA